MRSNPLIIFSFTVKVLDPIDGTRGFLKGTGALYVVGLALVVDGEISVGVMGCPNWQADDSNDQKERSGSPGPGIVMVAHIGCGTWTKRLSDMLGSMPGTPAGWERSYVDDPCMAHEARFCFPESITWESLPLSNYLSTTTNADKIGDKQVLILPTCCGSLCKYLMVASGRASVFILRSKAETLIKAWDHAVGVICVVEAGGQVTDWQGNGLDLSADKVERRLLFPPGGVLVTNGQGNLHHQILGMLSANRTSTPLN
ncbi:3'(2'),5'-bisphosphate nucleotidase [Ranunculus cassubicifolius]